MNRNLLLIASITSVFVIAFALTTFLHEIAHALVAVACNVACTLYHTSVNYKDPDVPDASRIAIAAAGPLFSLLQGMLGLLLARRLSPGMARLFWLYCGSMGMMVFLGYIAIGPFVPYGDSGQIIRILSLGQSLTIPLAVLAMFGLAWTFRSITRPLRDDLLHIRQGMSEPRPSIAILALLPLLVGGVLNVALSLPAPTFLSLVLPVSVSLAMLPAAIRIALKARPEDAPEMGIGSVTWMPVIAMLLLLALSRVLAIGISL
ncbi:MAG: hypothetical protein H7A35_08020 [Planctomycetales bacterium]|nr:hypothetical protein [bacterium]UNM10000.1 MAG: hypothetical protein H7A35_08020 [Planctomycetales bacterium]